MTRKRKAPDAGCNRPEGKNPYLEAGEHDMNTVAPTPDAVITPDLVAFPECPRWCDGHDADEVSDHTRGEALYHQSPAWVGEEFRQFAEDESGPIRAMMCAVRYAPVSPETLWEVHMEHPHLFTLEQLGDYAEDLRKLADYLSVFTGRTPR